MSKQDDELAKEQENHDSGECGADARGVFNKGTD